MFVLTCVYILVRTLVTRNANSKKRILFIKLWQ